MNSPRFPFKAVPLLLAVLALLPACSMDNEKQEALEREKARLRNDILGLTEKLKVATTELELEKSIRAKADAEVKATREKSEAIRKELEALKMEFHDYKREFHLQSRVKAVGEKHADLATLDGKSYKDVTIRSVLVDTITFSHADGQARLPIKSLGPAWTKRFDLGTTPPICLIDENQLKEACAQAAKGL